MEVLRLATDELELEVLPELGARWHRLRAFGRDLLRTPPALAVHATDPFFWGAYVMAPWCNRLSAGSMEWSGRRIDLIPNFPDGSAIHGQVYARPWQVVGDGSLAVEGGGDGWPWRYRAVQELSVVGTALSMRLAVENRSGEPMPAGLGLHPWFVRPLEVAIRAGEVFPSNVGSPHVAQPVSGRFDLRDRGPMPPDLDATWTRLANPAVQLHWPGNGVSATMELGGAGSHVVAASPRELDAVAVEPQTHAPDALRRLQHAEPGALALLEAGASLVLRAGLTFEQR